MSRIDELILAFCPQGIQFKKLGEVIELQKGRQLNKELLTELGKYPAYNGGTTYSGFTETYNQKENTIIISQGGASAGFVNFVTTKFYANAHCYVVLPDTKIVLNRYIYHFLKLNQENLTEKQHGAGIPALRTNEILKILIPIPPLEVQKEIVRTLDLFTELEAELEAELDARKTQYTYYRDQLLSFEGKNVEWKTLGEVGEFIRGNGLQKKDFKESGVGCIHYGQIYTYYGTYADKTKSYVSHILAEKLKKASKNDLIIAGVSENVEDVCKAVVWLGEDDICISGDAFIYKHKQNPLYIGYLLQTKRFLEFKRKYAQGAKVTRLQSGSLPKFSVPLPAIEEQERIVNILVKLDTLLNDISFGIPGEITARRKQYEVYRNKLLTFKETSNG